MTPLLCNHLILNAVYKNCLLACWLCVLYSGSGVFRGLMSLFTDVKLKRWDRVILQVAPHRDDGECDKRLIFNCNLVISSCTGNGLWQCWWSGWGKTTRDQTTTIRQHLTLALHHLEANIIITALHASIRKGSRCNTVSFTSCYPPHAIQNPAREPRWTFPIRDGDAVDRDHLHFRLNMFILATQLTTHYSITLSHFYLVNLLSL